MGSPTTPFGGTLGGSIEGGNYLGNVPSMIWGSPNMIEGILLD